MIRILLFSVLVLVGGVAGVGAGYYLRPEAAADHGTEQKAAQSGGDHGAAADDHGGDEHGDDGHGGGAGSVDPNTTEIVKLNNQFVVPILTGDRVTAMVVLSLSLETMPGGQEFAFEREPKIRDAFLQVLFDHANAGGFSGNFTGGNRLDQLRTMLLAATRKVLGDSVINVLVTDMARQDM